MDWNLPALTSLYSDFLNNLKDRDLEVAKQFDGVTVTNPVAGMKRWNATSNFWEKYSGTAWVALTTKYIIDVDTVDGKHVGTTGNVIPLLDGANTWSGAQTVNNNVKIQVKEAGATVRSALYMDTSNVLHIGASTNNTSVHALTSVIIEKGLDVQGTAPFITLNDTTATNDGFQILADGALLKINSERTTNGVFSDGVIEANTYGQMSIGGVVTPGAVGLTVSSDLAQGAVNQSGVLSSPKSGSTTTTFKSFESSADLSVGNPLLTNYYGFYSSNPTSVGTATAQNTYSFFANNITTLIGSTVNAGFGTNMSGGSNRFALYASGSAPSYHKGSVQIGGGSYAPSSVDALEVVGGSARFGSDVWILGLLHLPTSAIDCVGLTTSGGVTFGGSPSASPTVLDAYQEGTFTPTVVGTTTAGVGTYTTQQGNYTLIGNRVIFNLYVVITAHTGTGNIRFGGLPFTSSASANSQNSVTIGYVNALTFTGSIVSAYIGQSSTQIILVQASTGGASSGVAMDVGFGMMISGSYLI